MSTETIIKPNKDDITNGDGGTGCCWPYDGVTPEGWGGLG